MAVKACKGLSREKRLMGAPGPEPIPLANVRYIKMRNTTRAAYWTTMRTHFQTLSLAFTVLPISVPPKCVIAPVGQ